MRKAVLVIAAAMLFPGAALADNLANRTVMPSQHYSGVRQQQGRVQLDSDFSEGPAKTTIRNQVGAQKRKDLAPKPCVYPCR